MPAIKHKTRVSGTDISKSAIYAEDHEIEGGAIGTTEIADGSVTTAKIADNSITSVKIAADCIIAQDIATEAVGTDELADNAVTNAKMADNSVNTAEIVNNAVTTAKIADNQITSSKITLDPLVIPNLQIKNLSTDPDVSGWGTAESGRVWFNTAEWAYKFWNGYNVETINVDYADRNISSEQLRIGGDWGKVQKYGNVYYFASLNPAYTKACAMKWTDTTESMQTVEIPNLLLATGNSHYNPTMLRLSSGYLLAFSGYSAGLKVARSTNVDDISSWQAPVTISSTTYIGAYPEPWQDPDTNYVYVSCRDEVNDGWKIYKSVDDGATWSVHTTVTLFSKDHYLVPGRIFDTDDGRRRIHWAAVGPVVEYTKHQNVYYAYSDDYGVTWKKADETTITVIADALISTNYVTRVHVAINTDNNRPVVISNYGWRGGNIGTSDYESRVYIWNGASWDDKLVTQAGFVHGFNPFVFVVNNRIHAITEFRDSSYYISADEEIDPNKFYNSFKLVDFYADSPYTTWTKGEQTCWFKGHHASNCFYEANKYPIKQFYTNYRDLTGKWEVREFENTKEIAYKDLYDPLILDTRTLIDVIRIPVAENTSFTDLSYANLGNAFKMPMIPEYKLPKGNIVYALAVTAKQDTSGTVYLRIYDSTNAVEIYGSEVNTTSTTFVHLRSTDICFRDNTTNILQGYVTGGTGRSFEAFLLAFVVY